MSGSQRTLLEKRTEHVSIANATSPPLPTRLHEPWVCTSTDELPKDGWDGCNGLAQRYVFCRSAVLACGALRKRVKGPFWVTAKVEEAAIQAAKFKHAQKKCRKSKMSDSIPRPKAFAKHLIAT